MDQVHCSAASLCQGMIEDQVAAALIIRMSAEDKALVLLWKSSGFQTQQPD
jgi:hypothetical protein